MEEGKDYIVKTKFAIFMEVFSIGGIDIPRIIGICDTEEIAETLKKDLVKSKRLKNIKIFIAPIAIGEII